jgi:hypothetical protein
MSAARLGGQEPAAVENGARIEVLFQATMDGGSERA